MADVTSVTSVTPAAIALNRFGLGARAGETAPSDPKGWLKSQLAGASYQAMPQALGRPAFKQCARGRIRRSPERHPQRRGRRQAGGAQVL